MYECMTKGFLPTQCSEVSSQVRVVRCSHLVVPEDSDTHINMIEVGVGAASTPRGLHLLHAADQSNLDLELVCKSRELVKEESLLYVLTFTFTRLRSKKQDRAISWTSTSIPFSAFMPHLGVRDISKGLINHKNQLIFYWSTIFLIFFHLLSDISVFEILHFGFGLYKTSGRVKEKY